jgi:uroporphyrinogen-III synthase
VLTRRAEQSAELAEALMARGAQVVVFPCIAIEPPRDGGAALREALGDLSAYDWVVLSSANAVDALFAELRDARDLVGLRVAAVGAATARVLGSHGILADLVPEGGGAASLLSIFPEATGTVRVLLPRAAAGGRRIEEELARLGYEVHAVDAYMTGRPEIDPQCLDELVGADAVVFASPSAVAGFLELAGVARLAPVVVSIGPETSGALARRGITAAAEAAAPSVEGVVAALESCFEAASPSP